MPRRRVSGGNSWTIRIITGFAMTALARPTLAADAEIDADALRPGLVARYWTNGGDGRNDYRRLEPTIALTLRKGETPHPLLAPDQIEAEWHGYLKILRPGEYRFRVLVRGTFHLQVDRKNVLLVEVDEEKPDLKEGAPVKLEAGVHEVLAYYKAVDRGFSRVEVFWQSKQFRYEPLPFDVLAHLPKQAASLKPFLEKDHGRFLAEERNCVACHRPEAPSEFLKSLTSRQGPDLSKVGERAYAGWIYSWLEAPRKIQPGAAMPQLFPDDETGKVERHAVASYLATLGGPLKVSPPPDPKKPVNVTQGERLFHSVGCLTCHQPEAKKAKDEKEPWFLPRPALFPLAGLGSKTTPEKLAVYLANPMAIDPSGRMPNMLLQGNESQELARYLCASRDATISPNLPEPPSKEKIFAVFQQFEERKDEQDAFQRQAVAAQLVDLGKRLVIEKGCNNCHTIAPGGKPFANVYAKSSFEKVRKAAPRFTGCLAAESTKRGQAPGFGLTDAERTSLRRFLEDGVTLADWPAPAFTASVTLQRFNCLACHTRDGEGGLSSSLVEELRKYEKAENSEAVTPPTLTGIGHKLHTSTLRQVLVNASRARPWMGLRMPQFGEANVGKLAEQIASLEGTEPDDQIHKVALSAEKLEAGKKLMGKSGFGCVSCHDLANIPNSGTRGPDLARTTERVRYDWYLRWLEQPQRMQAGTRMPSVFTGGKSLLDNVLGGHADAQAEALWGYLSLGPGMPLPEGMEPPKGLILTVKDKPYLLRTFMPDAGSRALAVGYPDGVSVAFDAATCRLAYGWSGNFLDASPVWNDRGGAPAKVLGQRFWSAPPGCPWGVSYSNEPPDFARQASDPAYGAPLPEGKVFAGERQLRFDGYSVDKAGLPTFHYRVNAADPEPIKVSERPEPLRSGGGVGVARRFSLEVAAKQTPWLLAGETTKEPRVLDSKGTTVTVDLKTAPLELPADRIIVLPQDGDRALVLTLAAAPEGSRWQLRQQDKKWQVLVRLPTAKEASKVSAAVNVWSLYRDEPALLKEVLSSK